MQKPNVFLILLDSLRSDTLLKKDKSCITPNLDSLISQGANFTNSFSSADHTGVSWISMLTGLFPINSKINPYKLDSNIKSFVEIFKENNFKTFCYYPDISFFKTIGKQFDKSIIYEYINRDSYEKLKEKNFQDLLEFIKSQDNSDSWFNCIHLMDLKYPFSIPNDFNKEIFGKNRQEKMLSYLDEILGKLFETIDLDNSIIIFSSDHGVHIPITDKDLGEHYQIQKLFKITKNSFPFLELLGLKFFKFFKKISRFVAKIKNKIVYSNLEQRSFRGRNEDFLFDDLIHVPLVFTGKDIPNIEISNLVRHVDILPTIYSLLSITFEKNKFDGINLTPYFQNNPVDELIAYIESGPGNENLEGLVIGIRTSKFKYFRTRSDPKNHVYLFDIVNDPNEEHNLSKDSPEIVNYMEKTLSQIQKRYNSKQNLIDTIKKKRSSLKLE
jgi:arylsulfatase A-like enzyme